MNKTVIFDLDGTLAIIDKRRALAAKPNGKINWGTFFAPENIKLDEPNFPVIESFKAMKAAGFIVGIFSGRDEISRQETMNWLAKHNIDPKRGWMRLLQMATKSCVSLTTETKLLKCGVKMALHVFKWRPVTFKIKFK